MKDRAQPGDIVAGLVLLSLAAVIVQQSTTWPAAADVAGNPTVMPRVLAAIMALVGIVLIVARRVLPPQEEGGPPRPVHTIIAIVITAAFALLLEPIGLVVAGTLYLAALQRLLGASWRLVLPFAVGIPVAIWLIFVAGLHVPLPVGSVWTSLNLL